MITVVVLNCSLIKLDRERSTKSVQGEPQKSVQRGAHVLGSSCEKYQKCLCVWYAGVYLKEPGEYPYASYQFLAKKTMITGIVVTWYRVIWLRDLKLLKKSGFKEARIHIYIKLKLYQVMRLTKAYSCQKFQVSSQTYIGNIYLLRGEHPMTIPVY